jgi:hypothetical protein
LANFLSTDQVRGIMQGALRAPSQDNCQPWRFVLESDRLLVLHDGRRDTNPVNAGQHFSYLSLGCLLESIRLAAHMVGLTATWQLDVAVPVTDTVTPWAIVRFEPCDVAEDDSLGRHLEQRRTDRRTYRGGDLHHPVFGQLTQDVTDFSGCGLYLRDPDDAALQDFLEQVEGWVWSHRSMQQALLRSIRFTGEHSDGIPWQALGGSFIESRILMLCRWFTVQRLLNPLFIAKIRRLLRQQISSAAGVGCITVRTPGKAELVEAGCLVLRTWVRLNAAGFAYQPLAVTAIGVYNAHCGQLPAETQPKFRKLFRQGEATFRAAFGFGEHETPAWMFRTGLRQLEPLPWGARTPRLPLDSVLTVHGAGPV